MKKVKDMYKQLDAVGIGCRRCASSFLHDCLNQHPEITKPDRGIHFFSESAEKGIDWYFDNLPKKTLDTVLLEFSVSYTYPEYTHIAAKRIKETFPKTKLFVTVRNPMERAFSDYLRSVRNLEIPYTLTFEQAIESYPEYIDRGRYSKVLSPYFDLFASERIHVLIYEDLLENPLNFLNPLYRFLGVKENILPKVKEIKKGKRGNLRWPLLQSALLTTKRLLDQSAESVNCLELWTKLKKRFRHNYFAIRSINTAEAEMTNSTRKHLYALYKPDIDWIKQKTGRSLREWH